MSSNSGARRRSLLANAIDSLDAIQPGTEQEAAAAEAPTAPAAPSKTEATAPSFLERRGAAFDEIARTVKRPTIRIRPEECTIWPGNARDYDSLSHERCASLIDSIKEENGNREPVVIRRTPDGEKPYELIVGTRRHFSVAWLRANHHTQIDLIARIETLDDEGAFRLADIENREREDVTDLERARNYQHAVDAYYNGVRAHMAERLAIGKQNLHNLLQLAELPEEVVRAFANISDLKVRHGMKLSPLLKQPELRDAIIAEALAVAEEQNRRSEAGEPVIDGPQIVQRLSTANARPARKAIPKSRPSLATASGDEIGQIVADSKSKGITLTINPHKPIDIDEILAALRPVIEAAKFLSR
ncbi:chromosome partitioning protein, ParB family [Sphingobium sp. AP50]|uniref:ParB/RepB/Spo0J family partition protein n=1 Tax=Sphingobium sp. AP50 TaxID=1884369 RepID=UPI0008BBBE5A|nr:ParB/RepB/Spo0J family partition protein [Sphingobium sp. AP50]SEK01961.1 chromosome partitioning protein, ParB family [Sphingobium sp. AP50]